MKKFVTFLLFGFFLAMMFSFQSFAQEEEEIIELYPYNQLACLEATDACTQLKVGSAHWTWMYYGHRYHVVRGGVRYAKDFVDENADGFISPLEIGSALTYNAFGALTINDTDETVVLSTLSGRADITSVVHRIYAYFDEDGVLQMFEDQVHNYYIFNEADEGDPADWRLATQTEIDAFVAAPDGEKPITTRNSPIRMALDDEHDRGYVLEPLTWIQWTNADVVVAEEPDVEKWSTIISGNPNFVTIPAGWSTFSFSTFDRGAQNPLTTAYLKTLPFAMVDDTVDSMVLEYTHQPAVFNGLIALDDDLVTPGVQIVVDYQDEFDLPTTVTSTWINMFDEEGKIQNQSEYLDYTVTISQDDVDLETIEFEHDGTAYVASASVTSIDTSVFGATYTATFAVVTPKGDETERMVDIVVGVMPPKFEGIATRYINEGTFVDLLEGITADDGYGNDLTHTINVNPPAGFNHYYPHPGQYEIELDFTFNVFIPGESQYIDLNGTKFDFDGSINIVSTSFATVIAVYTDATNLRASTFSWGSSGVLIEVGADGTIIRTINRHNWDLKDENGLNTPANAQAMFDAWLADLTLSEDHYVIMVGRSTGTSYTTAQALGFGDSVSYSLDVIEDVDHDFVVTSSYMLNVDDITPPILMVVNNNFTIQTGQFANVNQAILSNVVAFDLFDGNDVAVYVANNGGLSLATPGAYTVIVMAEDEAGNSASVTFTITVVQAPHIPTDQEIQDMIDDAVDDLMDEIEALREELTPVEEERGCLGIFTVSAPRYSSAILPILGLMTLIGIVVFKRRF